MGLRTGSQVSSGQNAPEAPVFLNAGLGPLKNLSSYIEYRKETLLDIASLGGRNTQKKLRSMSRDLENFSPEITFIGQIKSGKTSLVNAMAGKPGLLPSDVNPWTSVVTSLHLNAEDNGNCAAEFRLFDADEWDKLIQNSGRIGELSQRLGSEDEKERLIEQVDAMRQAAKQRLGRKFELLLGQTHRYDTVDANLIRRYVCVGDDPTDEPDAQFADITKTADIQVPAPFLPRKLILRDTPGLNDTFLMREQVTIRAIRNSQICVVVLSAGQAMNSVDLGLTRLISTVKSRQIVIFVNRIDEVEDPTRQIPEIRRALEDTLSTYGVCGDREIHFGSALWAEAALFGTIEDLPLASRKAFVNLYGAADTSPAAFWKGSGLPDLYHALGLRIAEHAEDGLLENTRKRAAGIVAGMQNAAQIVSLSAVGPQIRKLGDTEIVALIAAAEETARLQLKSVLNENFATFESRVQAAQGRFVCRAVDALVKHLEMYGENEAWTYSPDGLRLLVRSAYHVMSSRLRKQVTAILEEAALNIEEAYCTIFDVQFESQSIKTPSAPDLPPPVSLAKTIVLDVKTPWWKTWSRDRKGYSALARDYAELIEAETNVLLRELISTQLSDARLQITQFLDQFIEEQQSVLADVLERSPTSVQDLQDLFGGSSQTERQVILNSLLDDLQTEFEPEDAA